MTIHNTHLIQQHRSHIDARKRLWGTPAKNTGAAGPREEDPIVTELRRTIDKLNREIKFLRDCLKHSTATDMRVKELELSLSDAHARILSQAEIIKAQTRSLAKEDDFYQEDAVQRRPVSVIVAEVLENFPGITWEDVKSVRRTRRLIEPRKACMKAVYHERKDLSTTVIGKIFGGRDHTTILHAVGKLESRKKVAAGEI